MQAGRQQTPPSKHPPPPPQGPPPSSSSQGSLAPAGQRAAPLAPEPRPNAWNQPLAGSRLSQTAGPNAEAQAQESPSLAQTAASSSGNGDSAHVSHSEGLYAEQNWHLAAEARPHSAGHENGNGPATGLTAEAQQLAGGYATEAQHLAQIDDLKASPSSGVGVA